MATMVTGAAGFIGCHLARRLLERGEEVVGVDNLSEYYDVQLKRDRLAWIEHPRFHFNLLDLADRTAAAELFARQPWDRVFHLAAQAGVRYSLDKPESYVDANLTGFANVLEGCRCNAVPHLVYASSSSVYGANRQTPFRVGDAVDRPLNLYAASKRANELMAHAYSHLFRLPTTGLRFFTVYGPWGRPDMAVFKFAEAIVAGRPIDVYNGGRMWRDFTFVGDIVEAVLRIGDRPPVDVGSDTKMDPRTDSEFPPAPTQLYNIGNHAPVELRRMIEVLEAALGRPAIRRELPLQPGDMLSTCADVEPLAAATGFRPQVSLEEGVGRFVEWFRQYRGLSA